MISLNRILLDAMNALEEMVFVVEVDEKSGFSYEFINKVAMQKLRFDESALGRSFYDLHSVEIAELLMEQYQKVLETGKSLIYEDSYLTYTGERSYSETRLESFFNDEKKCTHIVGIVKDITPEKFAELDAEEAWNQLEESKSHYQSLFEHNTDAVFTIDLAGKIIAGNAAVEEMSGYELTELLGSELLGHLIIKDHIQFTDLLDQVIHKPAEDFRISFIAKSGKNIGCLAKLTPIMIENEAVGIYAILKNMTELDKMIGKYVESENRFRIIAEYAHDAIILLNTEGEAVYASPSCKTVYGYKQEEVMAMPIYHGVHPEDVPELKEKFNQSILTGQPCKMQLRILHKSRGWIWSEMLGTPVFDDHQNFIHKVLIIRDIEQQKDYQKKLEYFAYHDPLTGLPNRRLLNERISEELEKGKAFAVMILDIDDFKSINDVWGHEVGDNVIREFGNRLSKTPEDGDMAARLGGDEFVVLLKETKTAEQVAEAANIIRHSIAKPFQLAKETLTITTSIGVALAPFEEATVSSLLKKADAALYDAKKSGKNYYRISE